jgi:hypothetical protein
MVEYHGPWSAQGLPDAQYQRLFSNYGEGVFGNVYGSASANPDSAGTRVIVQPFEAVCRGRYYRTDAQLTMTPAPPGSQPRIDRIVVRFDPVARKAGLAWVQGAQAANPAPPALTQTFDGVWEMPHSRVTISPTAPFVSAVDVDHPMSGMPVIVCRTTTRPGTNGQPNPRVGQPIYDVDLKLSLTWDGANWVNPAAPALPSSIPKMQKYAFPWPEPNPSNPSFNSATGRALLTTVSVSQSYAYSVGCYVQAEVGTKAAGTRWDLYVNGTSTATGTFLIGFTGGAGKFGDEVITPQTTVSVPSSTAIVPGGQATSVDIVAVRAYGAADGKINVPGRSLVVYTIPA